MSVWFRRPSRVIPLAALALGVVAALVWTLSPWPAALLIRALFEQGGVNTLHQMEPYAPKSGLTSFLDVPYGNKGVETTLDVFTPSGASTPRATVVWIHGGAWISGNKEGVRPYVQILAAEGYTTVAVNYALGPESVYPTGLTQLNDALGFLVANAAKYNIDPNRIVIAGDSAGANLTSQLATLITNPTYAGVVGIQPSLRADQLRGVVLDCGIYDVSGIPDAPGLGGWGFRIALWAYIGQRDWSRTPGGEQISTLDDVTADFPPTWISGGNDDPLTPNQSRKFAAKLDSLHVPVTTVFYPSDHQPALPHEYQFSLDTADAQAALASTIAFLGRVTG